MKCILLSIALFCAFESSGQSKQSLPDAWSRELIIQFSYSGGMNGGRTTGRITYDSCLMEYQSRNSAPVRGFYKMKDNDRKAIIKRLHELKANQIQGEENLDTVKDGWAESIRIGDLTLSAGPAIEMTEDSRLRFGQVYHYLEEFAIKKTKAK